MKLSNVQQVIKELDNINPEDDYAYEQAISLYLEIGAMPVLTGKFPAGFEIYHSRNLENQALYLRITDISIPPSDCVKSFARCNRPFQSVFYGSNERSTSYFELVDDWSATKKIGDTLLVTIGSWEVKKSFEAIIIPSPDVEKRICSYDKEHGKILDLFLKQLKGEELEAVKLYFRYLFEKFRAPAKKDPKIYIITSAFCNLSLMAQKGQVNAISYPSVPSGNNQGINLSFNKDFFKSENIELKSALRNELTITENAQKKYHFIETGAISSKEIRLKSNFILWDIK
jgi:hypothetical protein